MSRKQRNLVGKKFGKLTVIKSCGKDNKWNRYYSLVRCECGKEYLVRDSELVNGRRKRCTKCRQWNRTHGLTNTKLFNVWQSMRDRCYCVTDNVYKHYGGRGIVICEEWKNDFKRFYEWSMANGYKEGLSIDRIDVNGNYEPTNCRWVDRYVQANNRRNNHMVYYRNKAYTLTQLAREHGMIATTLKHRLDSGWDIEIAVNLEPKIGRNQYETINYMQREKML